MRLKRCTAVLMGVTVLAWAGQTCQAGLAVVNLVSDQNGVALNPADPQLINAWGISSSPGGSPFWVSDEATGITTLYNTQGHKVGSFGIPGVGTAPGQPTGQVHNSSTTDFVVNGGTTAAVFIFAGQDGIISAWKGGLTTAVPEVPNNTAGASYVGIATSQLASGNLLFAANQNSTTVATTGGIDVFTGTWTATTVPGHFIDPTLPANFVPYNIQNLNGTLYVTYFQKGNFQVGQVDAFDLNGNLIMRFNSATLKSPWGLAIAPANFGEFNGALLVGNLTDGTINAFNPTSGTFLGQLTDTSGNVIHIPGLWGLIAGNGGSGGALENVYFAAGPSFYAHGLFGMLTSDTPEPSALVLFGMGGFIVVARRFLRKRAAAA
jgi:uncharacterized protein (TIGR03118 family)